MQNTSPLKKSATQLFLKLHAQRWEQELFFKVVPANPAAIEQYSGLKHADDTSDAFFIAEMLRLGILTCGYIYDRKTPRA